VEQQRRAAAELLRQLEAREDAVAKVRGCWDCICCAIREWWHWDIDLKAPWRA
jgi:hypothetical protein